MARATVAMGAMLSCALDEKSRVVCFGKTAKPWLDAQFATPQVISPEGVEFRSISVTDRGLCALDDAGGRWCWGEGEFGTLSSTGTADGFEMVKVDEGWRQIALSYGGGCGVRLADSALWCWGFVGLDEPQASPETPTVQKSGAFSRVVLGSAWSGTRGAAIQADGKLLTWHLAIVGSGAPYDGLSPEGSWLDVDTQWENTCAVRADGTLWCWGDNEYGQCGLGHHQMVPEPTQVGSASDWKAVRVGYFSACGVRGEGDLYCWGWNRFGQAGVPVTPSTVVLLEPTLVLQGVPTDGFDTDGSTSDLDNDLAYATGHACARRSESVVACWGDGSRGQLGTGFTGKTPKLPGAIPGGEAFSAVAGASLLRKPDGSVWRLGRLGTQPEFEHSSDITWIEVIGQSPLAVDSGVRADGMPESGEFCAIFEDGSLRCNEINPFCKKASAEACLYEFVAVNDDKDWASVASDPDSDSACALKKDGSAWCRGGANGDGSGGFALGMTAVAGGHSWLDLSTSSNFACGVRADHSLWCWGSMAFKTLKEPTQIGSDTDWSDVNGRCARKQSGELFCWDQFGQGPAPLGGCASYSSSNAAVCFIKQDGSLWCVGSNSDGQLGVEGDVLSDQLQLVNQDTDWSAVSVGQRSTCALKAGGGLWCWGLADGRTGRPASWSDLPVEVTLP